MLDVNDMGAVVKAAEQISGWMLPSELRWLYAAARALPPGATWVELGVWHGRSFLAVACGLPAGATLVGIDRFDAEFYPKRQPYPQWVYDCFLTTLRGITVLRPDLQLAFHRCESAAAARLFASESCDVVFMDADHSESSVCAEIAAWSPKLKSGGLLCGHDFSKDFPGVVAAVHQEFGQAFQRPQHGTTIWSWRRTL